MYTSNYTLYCTYQFCGNGLLPAPESDPEGAVALGVRHAQVHPHLTQLVSNLLQLVTDCYQEERLILRGPAKIELSGKSFFFSYVYHNQNTATILLYVHADSDNHTVLDSFNNSRNIQCTCTCTYTLHTISSVLFEIKNSKYMYMYMYI